MGSRGSAVVDPEHLRAFVRGRALSGMEDLRDRVGHPLNPDWPERRIRWAIQLPGGRILLSHEAQAFVHGSAVVEDGAMLHPGVRVWHFCHVRTSAVLEQGVVLGKGVFVDRGVVVGAHSRIQNGVSIYRGVSIAPWVLVGPHVVLTNDRHPRAGNRNWKVAETKLGLGASLGAGAVLVCGIEIGPFALIGAGSVITRDVPAFHLAVGLPARVVQMVCACGQTQLALESPREVLLRPCCRENLDADLCLRAEVYLEERREHPTCSA